MSSPQRSIEAKEIIVPTKSLVQPSKKTEVAQMSEASESAAAERRRSSVVMYDPARDVFQPTPDALSTVNEETDHGSAKRDVSLTKTSSLVPTDTSHRYLNKS